MREEFWSLFELLVNIFEGFTSMHFICTFLGCNTKEKRDKRFWIGGSILLASTTTILNHFTFYEGIYFLIYIMVVFVFTLFLKQGTLYQKLFISIFFLVCIITISTCITNLISTVAGVSLIEIYTQSNWSRLLTIVFVQITELYVYQLLLRIFGKGNVHLRKPEWLLIILVFMISTIAIVLIQIAQMQQQLQALSRILLLASNIAIVLLNIIALHLVKLLNQHYHSKIENERLQLQLHHQTQYAETVQMQEKTVHQLRHDMKHTLVALQTLADQNDITGLKSYLEQYAQQLRKAECFVRTGNSVVDAIINTKLSLAHNLNIEISCRIDTNLQGFRDIDLCTLLGNLLDNAIEASERMIEHSEIILEITRSEYQLHIQVINRIAQSVLAINSMLRTTKADCFEHGYGISSIRDIAERYNGTVDFYEDDGWFVSQVELYIDET